MASTPTPSSLTETPARSSRQRQPRERVLPVAEIYSVLSAERVGGEIIASVIVGDEVNTPKRHGLRAPISRWVQIVEALANEGDDVRNALRLALANADVIAATTVAEVLRAPVLKPSGGIL